MSATLIVSNAIIIFVNLMAFGVMAFYAADIYKQKKATSAFVMFLVIALLMSFINSATIKYNVDDMVERTNAVKCKPSAIKKAPYNPKLIL